MSHYKEYKTRNLKHVFAFARRYPLANIMKNDAEDTVPSFITAPVIESDEENYVEFHMARQNPHFDNFQSGGHVSAVFNGPSAHISPSWYKDRFQENDRSQTAPTYNYMQAHITGELIPMDDDGLHAHLNRLVTWHESRTDGGWLFDELTPETCRQWMHHIQGFYIDIEHAEAIFKLSQEQNEKDIPHIIDGLTSRAQGFDAILAAEMASFSL